MKRVESTELTNEVIQNLKNIYAPEKVKKKWRPKIIQKTLMDIHRPMHVAESLIDHEFDDIFEVQRKENRLHLKSMNVSSFSLNIWNFHTSLNIVNMSMAGLLV